MPVLRLGQEDHEFQNNLDLDASSKRKETPKSLEDTVLRIFGCFFGSSRLSDITLILSYTLPQEKPWEES